MSPTITVVSYPDGTSNLDSLKKSQKKPAEEKPKSEKASKPLLVDVRKVTISSGTIQSINNHSNGTRDLVELTNVAVALTGLQNRGSGKLTLSAILRDENNPPAPAMYGLLLAKVDGSFNFAFTQDFKLNSVLGDAHLEISQAAGSFNDFAKLMGRLHCDFAPTEIKDVSLAAIAAIGELSASKFQLSRTNLSTPAMDLRANYNVSVDNAAKTAFMKTLNVSGVQDGKQLVRGQLTSPMTLAWGTETNAVGDSAFSLAVMNLNLADWKIFLGDLVSAGVLDVNLRLMSQQSGKQLTFDTTNQISNLAATVGGQHLSQTTVSLTARGQAVNLK
ncbi:MAG: hypothetical protein JF609_12490, partial [Verrucomicrobia bacterium]|nr:hypothetical protein [Verrucomicrobiota bacterium]